MAYGAFPILNAALDGTVVPLAATETPLAWAHVYNPNATVAYVQLFDTTGVVTLGTTAPKMALAVPGQSTIQFNGPAVFLSGIKAAATTTPTGNTAPAAALVANFGIG